MKTNSKLSKPMNAVAQHPVLGFIAWAGGMSLSFTDVEPVLQAIGLIVGILIGIMTFLIKLETLLEARYDRKNREAAQNSSKSTQNEEVGDGIQ